MYDPADLGPLRRKSIHERKSLVRTDQLIHRPEKGVEFRDWMRGLPPILKVNELRGLVGVWAEAVRTKRPVILGFGGHVIKTGLGPLLTYLMELGYVQVIISNGSGLIHDVELALAGHTSEDVAAELPTGDFGTGAETGDFFAAHTDPQLGLGTSIGRALSALPGASHSAYAAAARLDLTACSHVSIGADIIHMHPQIDMEKLSAASFTDFRRLIAAIADLGDGGLYLNVGSAVMLPEVFLKALSAARNLFGPIDSFHTANFDMLSHYRPKVNVLTRPLSGQGKSFELIGHHEIMLPLVVQALIDTLE